MKPQTIAGVAPKRSRAVRKVETEVLPPQIGIGFLSIVILMGAAFTGIGVWRVNSVFSIRDHEMEAGRLQELTRHRNDRAKALETRKSQLQGADYLRAAAVNGLGMMEPLPQQMETIVIPKEVSIRWETAALETRSKTSATKEVTTKDETE